MWYKYLNRGFDSLRVFRKSNLKFNQDDLGLMSLKVINRPKELLFKMARNQANLRGGLLLSLIGLVSAIGYVKSTYYDPVFTAPKLQELKRKEEQANKKARETLYFNSFGAPTRPTRSMDNFLTFIESSQSINKTFEFMTYGLTSNADQILGLDSYTTENDERMIQLLSQSKRRSGGH